MLSFLTLKNQERKKQFHNSELTTFNSLKEKEKRLSIQTLLILIADGAPGKPGKQVLKADTSLNGPRPHALMPATRNL